MLTKKLVAALAATMGIAALPAMGAIEYTVVEVQSAPPPMQVEVAPPAREGFTWVPGYYDYRDGNYTWMQGHFEPAREGYVYVAPRYERRNDKWVMYQGGWDRRTAEEEHGGVRNKIRETKDKVKDRIKNGDKD
jgi:hypothetical protein